jgi:hypothetical protein
MSGFSGKILQAFVGNGGQASNAPRNVSQRRVKRVDNNKPVLSDSRTTATGRSLCRPLDFDSFEIRLLKFRRLQPGPPGVDRQLTCSLEYESLINPPDYIALSYCWGDVTETPRPPGICVRPLTTYYLWIRIGEQAKIIAYWCGLMRCVSIRRIRWKGVSK